MATNLTVNTKLIDAIRDLAAAMQYQQKTARQLAQDNANYTQLQGTLSQKQLGPFRALVTAAQDHNRDAGRVIEGMQALVGALRAGAPEEVIKDITRGITDSILQRTHSKRTYDIAKRSTPAVATAKASQIYSTGGSAGLPKENCSWNDIKQEFFRSERVINANIGKISNTLGGLFDIGQHLYTTLSEIKKSGTILNIDECTKIIQLVKDYIQNLEEEVDRLGGKHDEVEGFIRELDLVTRGIVDNSIRSGGAYTSQIQAAPAPQAPPQPARPRGILNRVRKLFTSTPLSPPVQGSSPADVALYSLKQLTQKVNANSLYPNIRTINTLIGYLSTYVNDPRFNTDAKYRKIVFTDTVVQRAIAFIFRQILIKQKFPLRSGVKLTVMRSDLNRFSAKGDFLSLSGLEFTPFDKLSFDDKMNLPELLTALAPFPQAGGSRRTKKNRSRSKKRSRTRRY